MKFEADEQSMQEYSAIIQQIAYLDYQKNGLIQKLSDWEKAHSIAEPENTMEAEPAPEY